MDVLDESQATAEIVVCSLVIYNTIRLGGTSQGAARQAPMLAAHIASSRADPGQNATHQATLKGHQSQHELNRLIDAVVITEQIART